MQMQCEKNLFVGLNAVLFCLAIGIGAVSCANDDRPKGDAAAETRQSFLNQVASDEAELKDYGILFEVSTSESQARYWESDSTKIISLKLKSTGASDADLIAIGKSPEARDKLINKMSDLWRVIQAEHFDSETRDQEIIVAVLKVSAIRTQVLLPKLIDLRFQVLSLKSASDNVSFNFDEKFGLSLWGERPGSITNAEAIKLIEEKLAVNQRFEEIKDNFLVGLIQQTQTTLRLANHGAEAGLDLLKSIKDTQFLSSEDINRLQDLKKDLNKQSSNQTMDTSHLAEMNRQIINVKRASLLNQMNSSVEKSMGTLGLRFEGTGSAIKISEKSLIQARVRGTFVAGQSTDQEGKLAALQSSYSEFMSRYKDSVAPSNEVEVLRKVELFLKSDNK
jgi:hypothetical protein